MELPLAPSRAKHDSAALIRAIKAAYEAWFAANAENRDDLEFGTAYRSDASNEALGSQAIFSLSTSSELSVQRFFDTADSLDGSGGDSCTLCVPNEIELTTDLASGLEDRGLVRRDFSVMFLTRAAGFKRESSSLSAVPARSLLQRYAGLHGSFETDLVDEPGRRAHGLCCANALDDPRFDALCGRIDGRAVTAAGVFAINDIGVLINLFTLPAHRRHGYMRMLMSRMLDLCARSQYGTIVAPVESGNVPGRCLLESIGMQEVAAFPVYARPGLMLY